MSPLLLSAAADDIRDIRGPIPIPVAVPWPLYFGALALLSLAVWIAVRIWRRRRARPPTPYERARAQLMAAEVDPEAQRPDVFAERVSGAVREYIEARFQLPATHRTSEEFLSDLLVRDGLAPQLAEQRPTLTAFLHTCDFAKFAGRSLHGESMRALRAAALQFIDAAEAARAGEAA
ncbi:MAG TPA: DUF4381 family protein [Polyangiales bacterium]